MTEDLQEALQRLGKTAPKFTFCQKVRCSFRRKPTVGEVIAIKGHYWRSNSRKYECKYLVRVPESGFDQLKWEHALKEA